MDQGITEFFVRLGGAAALLVVAGVVVRLIRRSVERFLGRHDEAADPSLRTRFVVIQRLATVVVFFLAIALALFVLNLPVLNRVAVGMLASAGVLGIALGLAAQTTAANLVAGVMISIVQPLRLGDRAAVQGFEGVVEDIGLFYSRLRAGDNRRVLIPNQVLNTSVIENYTIIDPRTPAVVAFKLGVAADLERARETLLSTLSEGGSGGEPPGGFRDGVHIVGLEDGVAVLRVTVWAPDAPEARRRAARLAPEGVGLLGGAGFEIKGFSVETPGTDALGG